MEMFLLAAGCLGVGVLTLLFPHSLQRAAHWLANTAALCGSGLCAYAAALQLFGGEQPLPLVWGSYSLTCDGWSAIFLLLTGIAGVITSIYALGYARAYEGSRLRLLGGMWCLFIMSMMLVLLAGDAFSFLLFWEIMAVASFMLVNHESEKRATWNAAYQYLVMTSLGTAAIMIAFLLTGSASDGFSFAAMAHNRLQGAWQHLAFACAFIGFALKAGLVPLHVWLPKAHPAAPSHVSALMSGVMLKIALYGFGRFMFSFLPAWNYWWCIVVMLAGVLSAFLGVLYAQMETDIKRVLAYSSVENMGVIFAAFGCGMLLKLTSGSNLYMLGFVAGFPYLGGMSEKIATPRKESPRLKIEAGSVGIAGSQTGIYSVESPGGWQIIGRTPLKLYDTDREQPVLLSAGQYIKFKPISGAEYEAMTK